MGKICSLLKEVEQQGAGKYSIALSKSKEKEIAEPQPFSLSYTLTIAVLLVINFVLAGFLLNYNVKFNTRIKSTDTRIQAFDSKVQDLEDKDRAQDKAIFEIKEANKTLSYRLNMLARDVDSIGSKTSKK